MIKFNLIATIPVQAYTTVLADSYEEALEIAKNRPAVFEDEDERIFWVGCSGMGKPYDIKIKVDEFQLPA